MLILIEKWQVIPQEEKYEKSHFVPNEVRNTFVGLRALFQCHFINIYQVGGIFVNLQIINLSYEITWQECRQMIIDRL